ncbi:MAG: RluA family pseudouridine synthase, partial [Anaerolineales bacterium]
IDSLIFCWGAFGFALPASVVWSIFFANVIIKGLVTIDGSVVRKPGHQLEGGEWIEVRVPEPAPSDLVPEVIPLDVVFENEQVLIVNKPAGMVVHPSAGHTGGTLVHAVLAHAPDIEGIGGEIRPGVVHRLDKDTSGLIILAKSDSAHLFIQRQFKDRKVEKTYLALVNDRPPTLEGRIEAPIGRDPRNRKRMAVLTPGRGRPAISIYHTVETYQEYTLLEVRPLTGRTHQIRLHLDFIGCPVVGDKQYGKRSSRRLLPRQFLHAYKLRFILPGDDQPTEFTSPLPEDLQHFLQQIK